MRSTDMESQVVIDQENDAAGMSFWKKMGYYVLSFLSHLAILMGEVMLISLLVQKHQIKSCEERITLIVVQIAIIFILYKLNQIAADYGGQRELSKRKRICVTGIRIFYALMIVTAIGCVTYMIGQIDFLHLIK
ncbi:hypothetical protein CASFOL_020685 [Castilleja foliolosa]|uniref:Uncharacterized protein n=1 Tax=Castilleja foliolosa TaxID=1961234 RepID=A0ABD3D2B4_9LAMI